MTIELTPEHERLIEHAIHKGAYHDATDVISAALEALAVDLDGTMTKDREQEPRVSPGAVQAERRAAAIERLRTFGESQGLSLGDLTLRQLRDESRP